MATQPSEHDISNRRFQLFDSLLRHVRTGRVVDLATGHGKFAVRRPTPAGR